MTKQESRDRLGHLPHAIRRIREHYDTRMSVSDLRSLCRKIAHYNANTEEKVRPVMKLGDGVSLWLVKFKGHWYPAVWHERFKEIMTFLPKDAHELRSPQN